MPFPAPPWRTGSAGIWPVFWRWAAAWGQKDGPAAMAPWPSRSYPGLTVEVILWEADDEFPAQVSFTVPSGLDRFWQLDAVLGLMGLVVKELLSDGRSSCGRIVWIWRTGNA